MYRRMECYFCYNTTHAFFQWVLIGREPLEIFRLAAGLWYMERRDFITSLYTLLRVNSSIQCLMKLYLTGQSSAFGVFNSICFSPSLFLLLKINMCTLLPYRLLYLTRGWMLILWLTFRSTWKIFLSLVSGNG